MKMRITISDYARPQVQTLIDRICSLDGHFDIHPAGEIEDAAILANANRSFSSH
jgi:hypothetical protein